MLSSTLFALATASIASAHFTLNWPPTAGFDDDAEATGPCGGATVMVNSSSPQVQVDRFAIALSNYHPAGEWAFLGTTSTEEPYNFTEIVPVISSTGGTNFCLTEFKVPSEWAGKAGVIQVVDKSVDGTLYQCAPVNFVSGSNSTNGPSCKNDTGFSATWTTMESLNSSSASASASATSASASATSSGSAAMVTGVGSFLGLGLLAAGLAL